MAKVSGSGFNPGLIGVPTAPGSIQAAYEYFGTRQDDITIATGKAFIEITNIGGSDIDLTIGADAQKLSVGATFKFHSRTSPTGNIITAPEVTLVSNGNFYVIVAY